MSLEKKTAIKKEFAFKDVRVLLPPMFESMDAQHPMYDDFILLMSRLVTEEKKQIRGIVDDGSYTLEKNKIKASVLKLVDLLDTNGIDAIYEVIMRSKNPVYRILSLSTNNDEKEKMENLLQRHTKNIVKAALSNQLPDDYNTYDLVVFDNYKLGKVEDIYEFDDEERDHLELMEKWLASNESGDSSSAYSGFVIHYGKSCYLVNEYSDYCAAANFPYSLVGMLDQIIQFLDNDKS